MRAVLYESFGSVPRIADVPRPDPGNGGVLIQVLATGLCRSDVHAWAGHDSGIRLPHVPGHELVGRIHEIGAGVSGLRIGQRVTVPFVCACGNCPECESGNGQVCRNQTQPGFTHWGSFAEYVAIRNAVVNVIPVPDALDAGAAAILGCRFATSFRGLVGQAKVREDEWVVVVGCGGVGLSAVMIATALGARVIGVDIDPTALELATAAGAAHVIDSSRLSDADVVDAVRDLASGGAAVSVEALGRESTTAIAIRSLARRGRHVQIGLFTGNPRVPMSEIIAGELTVLGSHGMDARHYPAMLDIVASGRLRPEELITRRIPLDDAPAAMIDLANGRGGAGVTLIVP
ncbi:alcohol dehydrogenase [Mycetocola sp. CAN_C7]|uniref:zinc-binding dehydrogenase n=1 Tax=Mycetocola sp. CAN_C7 TaxID=2787724 RepID=UPI0018C9EE04